jgi:hypothetical protein
MTCRVHWLLLGLALACGPVVEETSGGSSGGEGGSDSGDGSEVPPSVDCSVPPGAIQARVVTGRGTQTIEVLSSDVAGPLVPLACADLIPRCGYELSLLTPVDDLVPATFTVDAGTLRHNVEYCTCCNGEDGGSDEAFGTYEEQETFLAIEAVSDACVVGWYETDSTRIEFVAERCAF